MATKRSIADQVLLRISKGYPDSSSGVQLPDVIMALGQKINELLKLQYFQQTLQGGDTIPDGLNIVTYPPIPVYSMAAYSGMGARSYCELPTYPIGLPMGLGVFEVTSKLLTFIPLQSGQAYLLQGQDYICDLLGNVGYETSGNRLIFTKDVTVDGVTDVTVKLLIMDLKLLTEFDILPIDAGIEATLIEQLVQMFAPSQTVNEQVDSLNSTPTQSETPKQ